MEHLLPHPYNHTQWLFPSLHSPCQEQQREVRDFLSWYEFSGKFQTRGKHFQERPWKEEFARNNKKHGAKWQHK